MSELVTIHLSRMRFHAFHGLYAEERKTGNEFLVDLAVSFPGTGKIIRDLDASVNYAALYELVKTNMRQPRDLLETVAMELAEQIHETFPLVKKVEIRIDKLQAPIPGFSGRVGVRFTKEY